MTPSAQMSARASTSCADDASARATCSSGEPMTAVVLRHAASHCAPACVDLRDAEVEHLHERRAVGARR